MMTRIIVMLIGSFFLLVPLDSHAMPKLWRKVCGEILSVDHHKQTLTLMSTKSPTALDLRLKDSTIYIRDHTRVDAKELTSGTTVTLFYKNPLLSSRFATRIVWETTKDLYTPNQRGNCFKT